MHVSSLLVAGLSGLLGLLPVAAAAQQAPATPPVSSTVQQRVDQRKRERNIALSERDQQRLADRCTTVQSALRRFQQEVSPLSDRRTKAYQQIDGKLWVIVGRLKLAQQDTAELEKHRTAYADKASKFTLTITDYKQALEDSIVMSCASDAVGFKALIETLRLYQEQLRAQGNDIQSYVVDTIKPALSQAASALQSNRSQDGESS